MKKFVHLFLLAAACILCRPANAQVIFTHAGNGTTGYTNGDGTPLTAEFNHPWGLALDNRGNLYIADHINSAIRKISASGTITTYAGVTTCGYGGDGGCATASMMRRPSGIAVDTAGNLFIADALDNRIRKISADGIISTIAGNGVAGYTGDGDTAIYATLNNPTGVAVDFAGNVYVADSGNNVIRKINQAGIMSTYAGTGVAGYSGDGGPANAATLSGPEGVATDAAGNLYIADNQNNVVRKINPSLTITTLAGNGTGGFSGDGGPATAAQFSNPNSIVSDRSGNVYIADEYNNRIRKVSASGIVTTIAGNGYAGYSGDNGPAANAQIFRPMGLVIDTGSNIYIADHINSVIRIVRTTGIYSGIPAAGNETALRLYPNPAINKLNVEIGMPVSNDMQIGIQNVTGQRVYKRNVKKSKVQVDVSSLPSGLYIINCYSNGSKISSRKFIKA